MPRPQPQHARPDPYPAEKARQGQIVLRATWQRVVFIGGLAAFVVLAFVLSLLR